MEPYPNTSATIIADSISPHGCRVTTFRVTHSSSILHSIRSHRMLSVSTDRTSRHDVSIITATDLANFFYTECKYAVLEMRELAFRMLECYVNSKPIPRQLHIPFDSKDDHGLFEEDKMKLSAARCAYQDITLSPEQLVKIGDGLIKNERFDAFEHCCRSAQGDYYVANFKGWVQFRKRLAKECKNNINYEELLLTR